MRRAGLWLGLAAAVVALDQLAKWRVLSSFAPGESVEVTGFFNMVLVFNKGAAFSFLAGAAGWQTPLLAAFAGAAALVLGYLILKNPNKNWLALGLALILGGAIGNLVDRLRFGQVVDFVDLHALGWHWPAFNVADSAITVGAVLLVLESFFGDERPRAAP